MRPCSECQVATVLQCSRCAAPLCAECGVLLGCSDVSGEDEEYICMPCAEDERAWVQSGKKGARPG